MQGAYDRATPIFQGVQMLAAGVGLVNRGAPAFCGAAITFVLRQVRAWPMWPRLAAPQCTSFSLPWRRSLVAPGLLHARHAGMVYGGRGPWPAPGWPG